MKLWICTSQIQKTDKFVSLQRQNYYILEFCGCLGSVGKIVEMNNYEKRRKSDPNQWKSVKLDIIPASALWIYSSVALYRSYF